MLKAQGIGRGAGPGLGPASLFCPMASQLLAIQGPWSWCWGRLVTREPALLASPTSDWTPILSAWDSQGHGYFRGVAEAGSINGAKFGWAGRPGGSG